MAAIALIAALFVLTAFIPGEETVEYEKAIRAHKEMMSIYMMRP